MEEKGPELLAVEAEIADIERRANAEGAYKIQEYGIRGRGITKEGPGPDDRSLEYAKGAIYASEAGREGAKRELVEARKKLLAAQQAQSAINLAKANALHRSMQSRFTRAK